MSNTSQATYNVDRGNRHSYENSLIEFQVKLSPMSLKSSRPLSLYDQTIEPSDRAILEREFHPNRLRFPESETLPRSFVYFLVKQFGKSLHNQLLRQATILFLISLGSTGDKDSESILIRRGRVIHSLNLRLNQPDSLDETDLFATFLLTVHFYWTNNSNEGVIHMRGCLAMIRHLFHQPASNHAHFQFQIFWPMILDEINSFRRAMSVTDNTYLVDLHRTLPYEMRSKECAERYYRILEAPWSLTDAPLPINDGRWWSLGTLSTRFLDLSDQLLSKKNGCREIFQFQKLQAEVEYSLFTLNFVRSFLFIPAISDPLSDDAESALVIMLDLILFPVSFLLLGATLSFPLDGEESTTRNGRRNWFTLFLREFWMLEECMNRIEGGLSFISTAYEMDPTIEAFIGETLNSRRTSLKSVNYTDDQHFLIEFESFRIPKTALIGHVERLVIWHLRVSTSLCWIS